MFYSKVLTLNPPWHLVGGGCRGCEVPWDGRSPKTGTPLWAGGKVTAHDRDVKKIIHTPTTSSFNLTGKREKSKATTKISSQVPPPAPLFCVQINLFEAGEHGVERAKLAEGKQLSWLERPAPTSTVAALENSNGKLSVSLLLRKAPWLRRGFW